MLASNDEDLENIWFLSVGKFPLNINMPFYIAGRGLFQRPFRKAALNFLGEEDGGSRFVFIVRQV